MQHELKDCSEKAPVWASFPPRKSRFHYLYLLQSLPLLHQLSGGIYVELLVSQQKPHLIAAHCHLAFILDWEFSQE